MPLIIYLRTNTYEMITVLVRGKFKWWGKIGWHRNCMLLLQGSQSALFLWCCLHASVIFQHMECRRIGLPELSHTKLIFTHWDLRTFWELPGKEVYVNIPHHAKDDTGAPELFPCCAHLQQMSFCSSHLLHRRSGCNLLFYRDEIWRFSTC